MAFWWFVGSSEALISQSFSLWELLSLLELVLDEEKDLVEACELIFEWDETLVILLRDILVLIYLAVKIYCVGIVVSYFCIVLYDVKLEKSFIWLKCLSNME